MPLTGTSKKATAPVAAQTIRLSDLLDQLDSEWSTLKHDSVELHGEEAAVLAYYHACVRPALYWVAGDPYAFQFPESYQQERLARLCAYLGSLQAAPVEQVKAAREQNLQGLRLVWPEYQQVLGPDAYPDDFSPIEAEVLPFSWDAIETLWSGENWTGTGEKARSLFLPQFSSQASASWHLASLAVLFLNRQLRYALTDLYPHQISDGRN